MTEEGEQKAKNPGREGPSGGSENKVPLEKVEGKLEESLHNIPHGNWRLFILSVALGFCLYAGFSKNTPNDTRSTFLSIGSAIITGLIRPFDR